MFPTVAQHKRQAQGCWQRREWCPRTALCRPGWSPPPLRSVPEWRWFCIPSRGCNHSSRWKPSSSSLPLPFSNSEMTKSCTRDFALVVRATFEYIFLTECNVSSSPQQLREPFFLILNYSLNQEAVCERSKYELFWRSGLMETGDNVEGGNFTTAKIL